MVSTHTSSRFARAAVVAVGLIAATIAVAMAARGPLSRSTPVNASSAGAPATALFLVLAGAGCVALAGIGMLIWSSRRGKAEDEPEFEQIAPEAHWIWKLLAILVPLTVGAALVAAALLGSGHRHPVPRFVGRPTGPFEVRAPRSGPDGFVLPGWLPWTCVAIFLVAIGVVVLFLVQKPTPDAPKQTQRIAASAALTGAIDALGDASDPREGVIAAYVAMQGTLAAHGVVRSAAEAPREYLRRVLIANRATGREAGALTGLFEEARFSEHPIPERVRQSALANLRSLRTRLDGEGAA